MDITLEVAQEISDSARMPDTLKKQLKNIEVDIYNAANEGKTSAKTALLSDNMEFFEDVADALEAAGFEDLHFLSISVDDKVSAVLEIQW